MSLLNANVVLGGWHSGVGGVKANGLTGVGGGGLAMVCWAPQQSLVVVVPV